MEEQATPLTPLGDVLADTAPDTAPDTTPATLTEATDLLADVLDQVRDNSQTVGAHCMRTKVQELLLADMNLIHKQLDSTHDLADNSAREMVKIHLEQLLTIYLSLRDRIAAL